MGSCLSLRSANIAMPRGQQQQPTKRKRRPPLAEAAPDGEESPDAATVAAKSSRYAVGDGGAGQLPASSTGFDRFFAAYAFDETAVGAAVAPRIGAGGVARLCRDLRLDPVDIRVLLLAWLCRAREMCAFAEVELRRGCAALRQSEAPTPEGLRAALDARLEAMTGRGQRLTADPFDAKDAEAAFKDLYRWAFDFGLESGQRTLQLPMATDLWALVFEARPASGGGVPLILTTWLAWLQSGASGVKGVSRDTWNMFLTFVDTCGVDLAAYDRNEAWPSLIDDFVEAETDRANQNLNC